MDSFNSKYTAAQIEALLDKINNLNTSSLVTTSALENVAMKSDLESFLTSEDLADYVTHTELEEALAGEEKPQQPQQPQEPETDTWTIQYVVNGTDLAPVTETVSHGTDYSLTFEPENVSSLGDYNDEDYDSPTVVADAQNKTITVTYSLKESEPEPEPNPEPEPEEQQEP